MGTPDYLDYSEHRTTNHHAQLSDDGQNVPAGDVISKVLGDSDDPVTVQFLTRLRASATLIGDHTDLIRAAVKQNADALKQAATDLMAVDHGGATALSQVGAIVDQTAKDTTATDVSSAAQSDENHGIVQAPAAQQPQQADAGGTQ